MEIIEILLISITFALDKEDNVYIVTRSIPPGALKF